jgi:glycosyltransferase involved in cell wall biosynthesis
MTVNLTDSLDLNKIEEVKKPKITVLVPAKNEEKNLPFVLPGIPPFVEELILVDGLSNDRTNEVARELCPDIKIVKQTGNGKGNAIRCGLKNASGDFIIMMDADGSMNPREIPSLIEPLNHGYDIVKGSRFLPGGGTSDMEKYRKFGNKVFLLIVNLLFKGKYSDLCYGYIALKKDALLNLEIESDGFEIETEINIKALKAGMKVAEIPSFENKRLNGNGSLKTFRDGRRILTTIFRLKFSNRHH